MLDSDIIIEVLDQHSVKEQSLLGRILNSGEEYCISSVNMHEVLYGIAKYSRLPSLVDQLPILTYNRNVSELSADLEVDAERKGKSVPRLDAMVAAVAINNGCSLHTLDRHFEIFTDRGLRLFR